MSDAISRARAGRLSRDAQREEIERAGRVYYYTAEQAFDDRYKRLVVQEMRQFVRPGRILELGYINDIWTRPLLEYGTVDIVEAASGHVERARADFAGDARITVFQTLFEDFAPEAKYDSIVMGGIVKHVPDDIGFLRQARGWLGPGGVVIAATPNSRSLHRRLGALMGLEDTPDRHNARDVEVFNVHLYDRYSWRAAFLDAGYSVDLVRGIFLKPFSTEQLMYLGERYDIDRIMEGLRQLGEELQDYAWYLLLVARA